MLVDERTNRIAPGLSADQMRAQLERILISHPFKTSRRCQALLRYVVETACDGRPQDLKERVVGNCVFGRDADYDTNQDAVVRNAAAEVRKRLAQYYQEDGHGGELRIDLPSGSYLPEFHAPAVALHEAKPRERAGWRVLWLTAGAALGIGLTLGAVALRLNPASLGSSSDLDRFWAPLVHRPGVVQICLGQSRAYYLPGLPPLTGSGEPDGHAEVPVSKMVPLRERFIYSGDAICMSRVAAYLHGAGKAWSYRASTAAPYSELRGRPVVLIGLFNNEWTVRLTQGLRFSLMQNEEEKTRGVHDSQRPGETAWKITKIGPKWDGENDYAIITRVFDPNTEGFVIALGGITHFGTMMAGDFLSTPSYFAEAVRGAPKGWERGNLQIVLETKIVGGAPGPPKVLATHFW